MERRLRAALAAVLLVGASPLAAQSAGTLPPLDPAYEDLARLEAAGLIRTGWVGQRPYSVARVRAMVAEAAGRAASGEGAGAASGAGAAAGTGSAAVDADLRAVLARLEARFGPSGRERPAILAEAELGGGESPGRGYGDNGTGAIDAVANPQWAYRGGRAYGDRATAAAAARVTLPVGSRFAVGMGARVSGTRATGLETGRGGATVEALYARAVVGRYALQVGRDHASSDLGGRSGLALSRHGPPLDLVRLSTDRPWVLPVLGEVDATLFAADLGPNQNFPHAKLFSGKVSVRPTDAVAVGLVLVNKQAGDGAPGASTADRLKDLSFFWDLFRPGVDYVFSEKLTGIDVRFSRPEAFGFELHAETLFTDIGADRLADVVQADAAFRLNIAWRRLGPSGRHALQLEAARVGPRVYRHHQFTSGMAVDRFVQGLELGPDGRSVLVGYGYHPGAAGWSAVATAAFEHRSADRWLQLYEPELQYRSDPEGDLASERRLRLEGRYLRWFDGGRAGVEIRGGLERVLDFDFAEGAVRNNFAVLVRGWFTL